MVGILKPGGRSSRSFAEGQLSLSLLNDSLTGASGSSSGRKFVHTSGNDCT